MPQDTKSREDEERRRRELEKSKKPKEKLSVKSIAKRTISATSRVETEQSPASVKEHDKAQTSVPKPSKLIIPLIKLHPLEVVETTAAIDKSVPEVKPVFRLLLPIYRLERPPKLYPFSLDTSIPEVKPISRKILVPIYKVSRPPPVKKFEVDGKICIFANITTKPESGLSELPALKPKEETPKTPEMNSPPSVSSDREPELPDVSKVFGDSFSKVVSARKPVVVLYRELENDSTIGTFETLCERIFRERGLIPRPPKHIKNLDEFNVREIQKYVEAESGKIVRVDLDLMEKPESLLSTKRLRETISRFTSGELSFLIFKTRNEILYSRCRQVLKEILTYMENLPEFVEITPKELTLDQKKALTEFAWGIALDVNENLKLLEGGRPVGTTLDDLLNKLGKVKREKRFEKLQKEKGGLYVLATSQHEGEESELHLQLKQLIVKLLAEKHGLKGLLEIEEKIKTEQPLSEVNVNGKTPIPDVWDVVENTVYEVETLFSEDAEGRAFQRKIYDSIKKYEGTSVSKINIVFDNLTVLLHLTELRGIKKNVKEWEKKTGKTVRFFVVNVEKGEFVSFAS